MAPAHYPRADLTSDETIEFAKLNASVVQPSQQSLNPYYLGLKIFEDIERRWDNPTKEEQERFGREPGQGRKRFSKCAKPTPISPSCAAI